MGTLPLKTTPSLRGTGQITTGDRQTGSNGVHLSQNKRLRLQRCPACRIQSKKKSQPKNQNTRHVLYSPVLQNSYTFQGVIFTVKPPHLWRALYSFDARSQRLHSGLAGPGIKYGARCPLTTSKRHQNPAICEHRRKNKGLLAARQMPAVAPLTLPVSPQNCTASSRGAATASPRRPQRGTAAIFCFPSNVSTPQFHDVICFSLPRFR